MRPPVGVTNTSLLSDVYVGLNVCRNLHQRKRHVWNRCQPIGKSYIIRCQSDLISHIRLPVLLRPQSGMVRPPRSLSRTFKNGKEMFDWKSGHMINGVHRSVGKYIFQANFSITSWIIVTIDGAWEDWPDFIVLPTRHNPFMETADLGCLIQLRDQLSSQTVLACLLINRIKKSIFEIIGNNVVLLFVQRKWRIND